MIRIALKHYLETFHLQFLKLSENFTYIVVKEHRSSFMNLTVIITEDPQTLPFLILWSKRNFPLSQYKHPTPPENFIAHLLGKPLREDLDAGNQVKRGTRKFPSHDDSTAKDRRSKWDRSWRTIPHFPVLSREKSLPLLIIYLPVSTHGLVIIANFVKC